MPTLKRKKLLKIIIREKGSTKPLMELQPTKANEAKAARMLAMDNIEVIREYER